MDAAASPRLSGRRILITGAAGGIGQATAETFAGAGARVALLDANANGARTVADRLGGFGAGCDVTDPDDVARAVAEADAAMGGIDGIVNAAGVLRQGRFADQTLADWKTVLDVNLTGTMLICQTALPALRRAGRGTIVNIASIAGLRPSPAGSAYSVSKAAVLMLTRCLAVELGPDIRVNSVCPGAIGTAMIEHMIANSAVHDELTGSSAAGRIGVPEEVARVMLFLTSDESAFVSGAALTVDGGRAYH